ncbi:hypothetical protein IFM89_034664 [Coptis chinensis]|uniref:Amine oxidase domain-containing protein n=1 Tax=Coptis chinensis TaxID=261450 RepID=A0A835HPJ5_9MAGN|nr:hypothetical protein IFM89_034664 [Coptis chinensis]
MDIGKSIEDQFSKVHPCFPVDTRITKVGAGPSGLSSAYALVKLDYKIITVLEKYHTVGGMCESVDIEDTYIFVFWSYGNSEDIRGPMVTKVAIYVLGFYEKLESELQGLNNTYYVGSLMAFELTERNSSYAMASRRASRSLLFFPYVKFVDDEVFFDELNEVLTRELAEDGEKGRRIMELTSVVQKMFKFPKNSVKLYAEKVNNRGL